MPAEPVSRFTLFDLPADVQEGKALEAAFSLARDRLDYGDSIVAVLCDAVAADAQTAVRALVRFGDDYLNARNADENVRHQFAEAVEALASVQVKAKAAALAALEKIVGES